MSLKIHSLTFVLLRLAILYSVTTIAASFLDKDTMAPCFRNGTIFEVSSFIPVCGF